MVTYKDIDIDRIYEAERRISTMIQCTPLLKSAHLSSRLGKNIGLKLENLHATGAFKLRGATNAILSLSEAEKKRGVVTMSTGNHGKAIAYVGKNLGIRTVICISELVPEVKVTAMRALGAEVAIVGKDQSEATENALKMEESQGLKFISAFDNPDVIAGQGTTALEIIKQAPNTDTIVVPVSGGGLMSGMGLAIKSLRPDIQLIGVTNDTEPAIYKSIEAGHIVDVDEFESLADALPGAIGNDNQYTFEMCRSFMDAHFLISEEQIADAMVYSLLQEKQVLEGGGAATIGLLLDSKREADFGENTVALCSGNSVDMNKLLKLVSEHKTNQNNR